MSAQTPVLTARHACLGFRICHDAPDAWLWCQHIYDLQVSFLRLYVPDVVR